MAYFNGLSDKMLGGSRAFASTGTPVRVASFSHTATQTEAVTDDAALSEENTHHYFAAMAKGDVVQFYIQSGSLQATTSASTLKFRRAGSTTEDTISAVVTGANQTSVAAPAWTATTDGILFLELNHWRKREDDDRGIFGSVVISRPTEIPAE